MYGSVEISIVYRLMKNAGVLDPDSEVNLSTIADELLEDDIDVEDDFELPSSLKLTLQLLEEQDQVHEGLAQEHESLQMIPISKERRTNQTVFDLLREKDLWAYKKIEIAVGRLSITLGYEHMGLSQKALKNLMSYRSVAALQDEEQEGGGKKRSKKLVKPASVTVFPSLLDARDALCYKRKQIQKNMFFDGSVWLCDDEKMAQVELMIQQELEPAAMEWRQQVLNDYSAQRSRFRKWLAKQLYLVSRDLEHLGEDPLDIESIFPVYENMFPSYQQVANAFKITVVGPQPVASLKRQAENSAGMAEALARLENSDLERAKIEVARNALERDRRAQEEAIAKGALYIENQVFDAVQEVLRQAEKQAAGEPNAAKEAALSRAVTQIEELMKMPGASALSEFVEQSKELQAICHHSTNRKLDIKQKIGAIRDKLVQELEFTPAAQEGSRIAPTRMKLKK